MTRNEFFEDVTRFYELRDFCNDNEIYECDDYFDGDDLDDEVQSDINNDDFRSWTDLRDGLDSIETGYDFYKREGSLYYEGCTDEDFDEIKSRVADIMDERGAWDPDEDDEDYEDDENGVDDEYVYQDPPEVEPVESINFDDLIGFQIKPLKQM